MPVTTRYFGAIWVIGTVLTYTYAATITYINGTGGSFPNSLFQQATFFYEFQSPGDIVLYDAPHSQAGRCNIMGYWSALNTRQILNGRFVSLPVSLMGSTVSTPSGTLTSLQVIADNMCNDACTPTNGCGFDSCLTPKPDKSYREPLGESSIIVISSASC